MKKLFLLFAFCALFLIAGCDSSKDKDNSEEPKNDADIADTEQTDDSDPQPVDTDTTDDTETMPEQPDDTDSTDDPDSMPEQNDEDSEDAQPDGDTDVAPADPCTQNPCAGKENSNGICTADGENFTCGCNKDYSWDGGACVLTANENVPPIPEGQSNTAGDPCSVSDFISNCDGNVAVWCDNLQIHRDECWEGSTCIATVRDWVSDELATVDCLEPCETLGITTKCEDYYNHQHILTKEVCFKTSKGNLLFSYSYFDNPICTSPCSEDGTTCETE